jgi:hypothetical protein
MGALAPDGSPLVVVSDGAAYGYHPDSLAQIWNQTLQNLGGFYYARRVAMANDGKAQITSGIQGSGSTDACLFDVVARTQSGSVGSFYFATTARSADGSRMVVGSNGLRPAPGVSYYNASTRSLGSTGVQLNLSSAALDRGATRAVLNLRQVYSSGFTLLGNLPTTTQAVTLSPGGTVAYTYDYDTTRTAQPRMVRAFDLNGILQAGAIFPEIGSGLALSVDPGSGVVMTISPDGRTLFLAGASNVLVQPAPQ